MAVRSIAGTAQAGRTLAETDRSGARSAQTLAGALLALPGVGLVLAFITAEALYPRAYSVRLDSLSHLGATEPPNSVVLQPSATIFDTAMLVAGAMLLAAAFFTWKAFQLKRVSVPIGLLGLGSFGVGVFPLTNPNLHTVFAILAFFSGGIAMILGSSVAPAPFRYLWQALGVISLVAITAGLLLRDFAPVAALGEGGIERWNVYPILLWLVAFGSHLTARRADPSPAAAEG